MEAALRSDQHCMKSPLHPMRAFISFLMEMSHKSQIIVKSSGFLGHRSFRGDSELLSPPLCTLQPNKRGCGINYHNLQQVSVMLFLVMQNTHVGFKKICKSTIFFWLINSSIYILAALWTYLVSQPFSLVQADWPAAVCSVLQDQYVCVHDHR